MKKKFGYRVDVHGECLEDFHEDKPEGDWKEEWVQTFEGVFVDDNFPDLAATLEIKEGEKCFVVWASWSQADSFGSADDKHVEMLGIFREEESALELEKAVEEASHPSWVYPRRLTCTTKDGQSFETNLPWTGMDSLGSIHIEETKMEIDPLQRNIREID